MRAPLPQGWIDGAKVQDVAATATALGLTVERGSIKPCPSCQAHTRGKADRRGPIGIREKGWNCYRCEAWGNALDLVCWVLLGDGKWTGGEQYREVGEWFLGR